MTPGGLMRQSRVRFDRKTPGADDGYGNTLPESWSEVATVSGYCSMRPGKEALEAGRLESSSLGSLMVRRSPTTASLTAADRAVFVAGPFAGRACQIRDVSPTEDFREIRLVIEFGVAV